MTRVLITGMSGLIGGLLRRHLDEAGGYELTALNRRPVPGVRTIRADVADAEAIAPAFAGQEVVVHLAAGTNDEDWPELLATNVVGARNVYEAARRAGVRRVVVASSGSAARGYETVPPYDAIVGGRYEEVPPTWPKVGPETVWPDGFYGATKVWGEALGRVYADRYGLSVLCVRLGRVTPENRPADAREVSVYLSHRDVAQFLRRCIEAPAHVRYDVFFATSNNRWGYRDIDRARRVLGYEPQDSFDRLPA